MAYPENTFGSITLDGTTCILTYNGAKDKASSGVKPIAIMIEDFNVQGNTEFPKIMQSTIRNLRSSLSLIIGIGNYLKDSWIPF